MRGLPTTTSNYNLKSIFTIVTRNNPRKHNELNMVSCNNRAVVSWLTILLVLPLPSNAFVQKAHSKRVDHVVSYSLGNTIFRQSPYNADSSGALFLAKKQEDNGKKKRVKKPFRDLTEEEKSLMGNQRTLYNTLDTLITTGGILFILVGFALNLVGLDYVVKDGRVTIGTAEDRKFQKEMVSKRKTKTSTYDSNTDMLQMQPRQQREERSPSISALEEN